MFLYELALELDEKSADLAAFAQRLGIEGLSAPSTLTREQVAAIRAAKAGQPVPGAGPAAWSDGEASGAPMGAPVDGLAPPADMPHLVAPASPWGAAAPPPPGELPPPDDGDQGRPGVAQKATIGVALLLVAALFGYMVMGTGKDTKRVRQLAAKNVLDDAKPLPTLAPIPSTTTTPRTFDAGPTQTTAPPEPSVDAVKFCTAARHMAAFELRVTAGEIESDWQSARDAVKTGQATWEQAVTDMIASGPSAIRDPLGVYRDTYHVLFSHLAGATSSDEAIAALRRIDPERIREALVVINNVVGHLC
jgi:hypothetical protein